MDELILDGFGLTPSLACPLYAVDLAHSTLGVGPEAFLGQVLLVDLDEPLTLGWSLEIDGELWQCWVLSTSGFFPSVYANYNFNSFAHFQGADYAADENGIYELGGADDDGAVITTGILFHPTAFRNTSRRKFRKVFVNAEGERMRLEAKTDSGSRVFEVQKSRAPITRDLRGSRWQFAIQDFDSFDFFEAFQTVLSR